MNRIISALVALLSLVFVCAPVPAATGAAPAQSVAPAAGIKRMAEQAFARGAPVPVWVAPIDTLPAPLSGVALSVRLSDVQFHVGATSAVYAHRALTANEPSSLAALGQYELQFQPEYQQLALHTMRVLRAGAVIDKLASADVRFLQRETNLDQGVYSGTVTVAIVTDDVRVGDTVELEYTITGQNPVFGGAFFEAAQWDSPAPAQRRRIILDVPRGRTVHYKLIGGARAGAPVVTTEDVGERHRVRFEATNIAQTIAEPYLPDDVHPYRFLQFSEFDTWREVNQWALGLFAPGAASPALDAALAGARAAATGEQAVAGVLAYVQNEIRYLSISLGENSHRPFPPDQVLKRRYGDCKDKSLLMVTMLRALGIEAAPVLVSTGQHKGIDQMLPSPLLFDHAIVRAVVGGKTYFFDPTRQGQSGALERMGQVHAGAQGLVIERSNPGLATIAAPAAASEVQSARLERVTVTALDQPVEMLVRRTYDGISAEYLRVQLAGLSKESLHKAYDGVLGERYPDSVMLGEPVVVDERERNRITIESQYRIARGFFEASPSGWQVRYVPANLTGTFNIPGNAARQYPLAVPNFPSSATYEFELLLPDTFDAHYHDTVNDYKFAAFDVSETLSFNGHRASAKVALRIGADRVPHDGVVDFLAALKKLNTVLNGGMFLRKSDLKSAQAARPKAAATPREQMEANLAAASGMISDAEKTGDDASDALCERALAHAYLGHEAAAHEDAARALAAQPRSGELWKCMGDVEFAFGKFKESDGDYAKAVARGGKQAYLVKGLNEFFLGKQASARADLQRARDGAPDQALRHQAEIWLLIVDWQPAKEAAPAPAPASGWRLAALNMFAADGAPDEMLRLANQDGAGALDQRLTEAYFYAGKYYQLKRDQVRARVYFRQSLDRGVLDNVYYIAARHELERTR